MRFRLSLKARPMFTGRARRSSRRRLMLEWLEDRVVPSIADGTVLVCTFPSTFASGSTSSFPTGIIGVNPQNGLQSSVSINSTQDGDLFSEPTYVIEAPNGLLYVTDLTSFTTGAVIQVNPNTGQQTALTHGQYMNGPNVLAWLNGQLYVACEADGSGSVHTLVQVNPTTGAQTLITDGSGGGFTVPTGMEPGPGNTVYVSDEPGGQLGSDPGGVWQVNVTTGAQTLITHDNLIAHPVDLGQDQGGNLLTVNVESSPGSQPETVVSTNPANPQPVSGANQTLVYQQPNSDYAPDSVTENLNTGVIYVGSIGFGANPAVLLAITGRGNSATQTTVASGGQLSEIEGIRVYHPVVTTVASNTVVSSSANPQTVGQAVTWTATVTPSSGSGTTPTGTVQFAINGTNFGPAETLNSSGIATSPADSTLAAGTYAITATYSGDGNYSGSSGSLSQVINSPALKASSTVVHSSANPQTVGQPVTWTATVTPSSGSGTTPTGTVQFAINGTNFGPAEPLNAGGIATSPADSTLAAGTYAITATYSGDGTYSGSSGSLSQVINSPALKASSTVVNSSANPQTVGQPVTWTATVTPSSGSGATPTGTVQFAVNGTNFGPAETLNASGIATSPADSTLAAGTYAITATYSGDGTYSGSSGSLSQVINSPALKASSTVVHSSANPQTVGQPVTWTATVTPSSGSGATPTGTVQFAVNGTNFGPAEALNASGIATSPADSTLAAGTYAITATYSGDGTYSGSSGSLSQVISGSTSKANSSTVVSSSANPQTAGQPVTWTATVTQAAGEVNFVNFETGNFSQTALHQGGAIVTSPALNGAFSLQLARANSVAYAEIRASGSTYYNLPTAYYSFLFEFSSNPGEGGIVNFQDTASGYKAAIHLSSSDQLLFYNQNGTLLATGSTTLQPNTVYTISAMIGTGSSAAWQVLLNGSSQLSGTGNLGTTNNGSIKLGGNNPYNCIYYYDDVQINSQGYPGPVPTGTVQFAVDGTNFGSAVTLSDGMATSPSDSTLSAGTHAVTATYSGDSNYNSSSGSFSQVISGSTSKANSSTVVSSSANPQTAGQSVTWTATVTPSSGSGTTPTGTVQFAVNGTNFGPAETLNSSGVATSPSDSTLAAGTYAITATYSGDSNYNGSSGSLSQVISGSTSKANSSTVVSSSANPQIAGQPVTWTATVTPSSGSGTTPTGTVQFAINGTAFGSPVTLSGGKATSPSDSTLAAGTYAITATYSGDGNYNGSSGSLSQVINSSSSPGLVNYVDFETGNFSQCAAEQNATIVTSPALDGTYSLQLFHNNSVAYVEIRQSGTTYYNLPTAYYSFLFEFSSNSTDSAIANFQNNQSSYKATLHLSSSDKLTFYGQAGALLGTGSTTLQPNTIYTLSVMVGTGTSAGWQVLINGNVEMSGTGNLATTNNGSVRLGGNAPYTNNFYYDDVAIASQGYPTVGGGGGADAQGGSPAAVSMSPAQASNLDLTSGSMAASSTPPATQAQVQSVQPMSQPTAVPTSGTDPVTVPTTAVDALFANWDNSVTNNAP